MPRLRTSSSQTRARRDRGEPRAKCPQHLGFSMDPPPVINDFYRHPCGIEKGLRIERGHSRLFLGFAFAFILSSNHRPGLNVPRQDGSYQEDLSGTV
jgi:hypothetical protein